MDIRRMQYFCAIVEEGQISKAAQKLHMAQPPLSLQLKTLEDELGVELFIRDARKLILTEAGSMLYQRSKSILELVENTKHEIIMVSEGKTGFLSMGCIDSMISFITMEYIKKYREKYSSVSFNFYTGDSDDIIKDLRKQVIEFGIIRPPFDKKEFLSITLSRDNFIAVVPDLICSDKGSIDIEELCQYPLLIHKRYRNIIEDCFTENGFKFNPICNANDIVTLWEWAKMSLGVAIVPKLSYMYYADAYLHCRTIRNQELFTETVVIWDKRHKLSVAAENFLKLFEPLVE